MKYAKSTNGFYDDAVNPNIPADAVIIDDATYEAILLGETQGKIRSSDDAGNPVLIDPEPPSEEQIAAQKVAIVQKHMDDAARAYRYDDIKTACTYAEELSVPKFHAEGQAFRAWRSLVWARCYEILEEVRGGARAIPSDDELIAELPKLQIPSS